MDAGTEGAGCSFCGRSAGEAGEAGEVFAGPGMNICRECAGAAEAIVREYTDGAVQVRLPRWDGMGEDEMLAQIPRIAAVADQVEADLRVWVRELRGAGSPGRGSGACSGSPGSRRGSGSRAGSGSPARSEVSASRRWTVSGRVLPAGMIFSWAVGSRSRGRYHPAISAGPNSARCGRVACRRSVSSKGMSK
ncbi:ClpX C4-type zinc finger protein [Actinomadura namibiensis]|uniref:ClpX C4-type zinc finger protein n=1 Tax=Actinomadura kijaniata TaxID=46161 RepID=UPI0036117C1C